MTNNSSGPPVSFVLLSFNQERYVRQAITGALAQTYRPLEIILSDDGSSDQTFQVMQEMAAAYSGPHTIKVRQSSANAGFASHVNAVAKLVSGDLIVLAAGDDISKPERASVLVREWLFRTGGSTAAIYSSFAAIDEDGQPTRSEKIGIPPTISDVSQGRCNILGATSAYTRDVFDRFPLLNLDVRHEDRVFPFRTLLMGGAIISVDEDLVQYRVAGGVSRTKPKSIDDFLGPYTLERHRRGLPDAVQRLDDLRHQGSSKALTKECRRTIQNHRAMIALIESKPHQHEAVVIAHLLKGAAFTPLIKHYVKMRMRGLLARRSARA